MTTAQRARRQALVMSFAKDEALPTAGDTRIMRGGYGTTYAVTIHSIKRRRDGDKYIYLDVTATRRVVAQMSEAELSAEEAAQDQPA